MVAKVVCEISDGVEEGFEVARLLYTGTSRRYFRDSLLSREEFSHRGRSDVYLDERPWSACGYAAERARFYGDNPIVLAVGTKKLRGDLYYDGRYRTSTLNVGSFLLWEISLDSEGRVEIEDYRCLLRLGDAVQRMSEDEVRREIDRFLSQTR